MTDTVALGITEGGRCIGCGCFGLWCRIRAAKALGDHRIASQKIKSAFATGVAGLLDTLFGSRIPGAGTVGLAGRAITVGSAGRMIDVGSAGEAVVTVIAAGKAVTAALAGPEGNSARLVF